MTTEEKEQVGEYMAPKPKRKLDDEMMMALVQKTAEGYAQRMKQGEKIGINTVLEEVLSAIMAKERDIFLQRDDTSDAGNGFYSRTL